MIRKLYETNCSRCGQTVFGLVRPLYGSPEIRKRYGVVCTACSTSAERVELNMEIGRVIAGKLGK